MMLLGRGVLTEFLSTPSARRATVMLTFKASAPDNFYPRPLRGGRPCRRQRCRWRGQISIHALCEEGDLLHPAARRLLRISIHALCEEGDLRPKVHDPRRAISIHALCEEGDVNTGNKEEEKDHISIHALCEEGD